MRVTTINFQRASCTLDGCIEIWTSRLDSVGTETVKLASNLASGRTGDGEDEDDDASDDPDGDRTEKRRKKNQRTVKTLVTDPAHRKVKKLDLEFSVNPLFRKTCAEFDEGAVSLYDFSFTAINAGADDLTFYQDNTYAGPDDDFSPDFDMNGGPETEEDFFTGNDAVNDDFGGNTMGGNDFDGAT
ncbi:hypothetical protein AAF712_014202 [Marasmius tenuissimus]|uniref:Condensin complex subunit 2 n=1 Tax=Marasmius tenuissimus TaxID=585030 RepID=A0ABR2ZDT1_9AGAR